MHIGGLYLDPGHPNPTKDPASNDYTNWSLGKWLQLAENLQMKDLKHVCLRALIGIFFSKSIQNEGMLASVISDLSEVNNISSRSLAEVVGVMGMWVNTLVHGWSCRKCGNRSSIPRGDKCGACGQTYQQDCLQFGLLYAADLMPLFTADEEIVLQMFKSIDSTD